MIHLWPGGELGAIVLHRALLEAGEGSLHLRAVVGVPGDGADGDSAPVDMDAVAYRRQLIQARGGLVGEGSERRGGDVAVEVLAERLQPSRGRAPA